MPIVLLSLILLGRVFQSFGPYTLNDLSTNVYLLVEGTSSCNLAFEECSPGCFIFFSTMTFVGTWVLGCCSICRYILQS